MPTFLAQNLVFAFPFVNISSQKESLCSNLNWWNISFHKWQKALIDTVDTGTGQSVYSQKPQWHYNTVHKVLTSCTIRLSIQDWITSTHWTAIIRELGSHPSPWTDCRSAWRNLSWGRRCPHAAACTSWSRPLTRTPSCGGYRLPLSAARQAGAVPADPPGTCSWPLSTLQNYSKRMSCCNRL